MEYEQRNPPYAENLMRGRIAVAETYKQAFDSRLEENDWQHHRAIREPGARGARGALEEDSSLKILEFCYDIPNQDKRILKVHRHDPVPGLKPCVFFIHGGLMSGSDRYVGVNSMLLDWGRDLLSGAVVLSVEYGRPPQSGGLEPSDDCWQAFRWAWKCREGLGIDPERTVVYGASAGGCLAASMALRWMAAHGRNARLSEDPGFDDFGGVFDPPFPDLKGVYLEAPMIDDRHLTVSRRQYAKGDDEVGGNLTSTQIGYSWGWLLNVYEVGKDKKQLKVIETRVGTSGVSILEAPGRATAGQLEGFPPVCVEVGDADPLRDEGRDFVDRVNSSNGGGRAEYMLCKGGVPHGGWAIDAAKKEAPTRDILSARVHKLGAWLA